MLTNTMEAKPWPSLFFDCLINYARSEKDYVSDAKLVKFG